MSTHGKYADWDGAYVMGALSRSERLEYEEHLAGCPECSEAVADLGALPGLLALLDRDDAELLLRVPVADAPPDLADRLRALAPVPWWRRGILRSARVRGALVLAAAALVAMAVIVPVAARHHPAQAPAAVAVALQQTRPSPISAQVALTPMRWGTRIDMTCTYALTPGSAPAGPYGERPYSLYVVDGAGRAQLVSNWHAGPGETARTSGSTALAVGAIRSVELRAGDGTVLLNAQV